MQPPRATRPSTHPAASHACAQRTRLDRIASGADVHARAYRGLVMSCQCFTPWADGGREGAIELAPWANVVSLDAGRRA
jgi:hypothetical protein